MKGREDIIKETHILRTKSDKTVTRGIPVRRTERQLVLIELIAAMEKTLNAERTAMSTCDLDREAQGILTKGIKILRKRIAGFGKEFWEIDKRINPEYHDPASWDRDMINNKDKYLYRNGIKIINEIFNRKP